MSLFDLLSEQDKETFISYIKAHGCGNSSDYEMRKGFEDMASAKVLLEHWDREKSRFIKSLFGDNLIIRFPIEYSLPREDIDFSPLRNTALFKTLYKMAENEHISWTAPCDENDRPHNFIYEFVRGEWINNRVVNCYWLLGFLRNSCYYYDNIYSDDSFELRINGKTPLKIVQGMKYSRAVGKIAEYLDINPEMFEEWRQLHSQLINTKLLKGNLCLSIHPMDYITISDACFTSCMSWIHQGGYRRGTVEMMNSPNVIVAYLESANDSLDWYGINGNIYHWNKKKWRTLLIAEEGFAATVKAYPYRNDELATRSLELLTSLYNCEFYETIHSFDEDVHEFDFEGTPQKMQFYTSGAMYCDMGYTTHFLKFNKDFEATGTAYECDYSGPSECMFCGSIDSYFEDESTVFCEDCMTTYNEEDWAFCDCCGSREPVDDVIWVGDHCYCEHCAAGQVTMCTQCGEYIEYTENARPIVISYKGINDVSYLKEYSYDALSQTTKDFGSGCICDGCLRKIDRLKNEINPYRFLTKEAFERNYGVPFNQIEILSDPDYPNFKAGLKITAKDQIQLSDVMQTAFSVYDSYRYSGLMVAQNADLRTDMDTPLYTTVRIKEILATVGPSAESA